MKPTTSSLDQIFATHIGTLALTLRPNSLTDYRCAAGRFLTWLHTAFPRVCRPSQLRRDPHLLAWFRHLCERQPPLSNQTRRCYLLCLRRMLDDLAANGHPIAPDLIRPEDFPPSPKYLPRPLSPQDDQLLQQELRRTNDLNANALLLMRATGIRIRECIGLPLDCLRQLGADAWALHVPIGKLHNERLVPVDADTRRTIARLIELRTMASAAQAARSRDFLLPRLGLSSPLYHALRMALADAARRAACSCSVKPHQLRPHICHGNDPPRRQPSRCHATAGSQGYSHDSALRGGHTARLTTRIPHGSTECTSIAPPACSLGSQLLRHR